MLTLFKQFFALTESPKYSIGISFSSFIAISILGFLLILSISLCIISSETFTNSNSSSVLLRSSE